MLTLDDRRDLLWYFNEADGDFGGLRSSFGAQIDRLRWRIVPSAVDPRTLDDDIIHRIERAGARARIYRRLALCGAPHARTLRLVFEWADAPSGVVAKFGELAALAGDVSAECAPKRRGDWFERMCCRRLSKEETDLVNEVRALAELRFAAARDAYLEAKRDVR